MRVRLRKEYQRQELLENLISALTMLPLPNFEVMLLVEEEGHLLFRQ